MERSQSMNIENLFVSERKKSDLLLYRHFCNNVFLGQWESAKADARHLNAHGDSIAATIRDVLLDIIRCPYNRSSVHGNIVSPYHLSWLCLQEYLNLGEDDISQDERSLQKNSDFQFLLFEACKEASDTVIKDLHRYHGHVCLPDEKRLESVHLSSELQHFLQELLTSNPLLGHSVIQALIAHSSVHVQIKKNNDILQNVYILSVQNVLEKCSKFCTIVDDSVNRKKKVDMVKTLLTLYNPDSYQNYLPLRELFSYLFELSSVEGNVISRQEFLSCLTGKQHPYLLQEYCKLEHELQLKTSPTGYSKDDSLCNYHHYVAHLMKQPVRSRLKWLMLLCLNEKQHLLKIIVETAVEFIRCGEFQELGALLEPEELQPLRVFILLHGWSYCQSCTQAKILLETLLDTQGSCQHPALEAGCRKLAYQIDLIQWCLDRTKPLLREDTSSSSHQQRAADMFLGLENHSVLYVLHQSTRISSLDQEEVLSILHKSPSQGELGGSFELSKKKTKSVRFSFQNDSINNVDPDIHIERWKDISIFSGFCAIKNVMDVIYFCAENHESKEMQNYVYKNSGVKLADQSSKESSSKNAKNFQQIYDENVKNKLKKTQSCLSKLQPLTFRVEILENIYSLLFVTHEDIQEVSVSAESDSGEFDDYDNSRNNTLDDDSLRLSIVSEISEEGVSPTLDKTSPDQVFDNIGRTENTVIGSYDEPFVETSPQNKPDLGQAKALNQNKKPTSLLKEENIVQNTTSSMKWAKQKSPKPFKTENFDASRRGSGNGSTHSTESVCSGSWFGFLTPDYLVLEILAMLKDSLLDLSAARFKILGGKDSLNTSGKSSAGSESMIDTKLEQPLTVLVESGIRADTLQSRIAHLTQYVHEAQWRFQLICHDRVQKQTGEMSPIMRSDKSWDEDKEMEMFLSDIRTRRRSIIVNKASPSPDCEKQIEMRHEDQQPVRSRSHSRRQSRGRASHKRAPGIIPLMLSSPDTLLNMCIRRGNYPQASQVTKLLKLEDRPEVIEVPFSQAYNEAIKKLHGLNVGGFGAKSMKPGKTSMNALASVAAAGVATISINSVADKLLSVSQLPRVPRRSKSWGIIPSQTEWCFQQENAEAVILFDLLCIGCRTWEMCNNMVDVIKTHLNVPKTVKDGKNRDQGHTLKKGSGDDTKRCARTDLKIKSLSDMLRQFDKLLHLGADIESGSQQNILIAFYKHSIQTFLQTATLSLSSEDCKTFAGFVSELKKNVDRVETAILLSQGADNIPNMKKESPSPSPKKNEMVERQTIHTSIKHLIQMLNKDLPLGGLCSLFTREVPVHCQRNRDFLLSLYEHVKGLSFVVAENEANSKETIVIPKNYFVMLEEGPVSILGRLIFSRKIPPGRLEKVAKELSLNLTHIIVHSCCPSIPSKHNSVENLVHTSDTDVPKKRDSIVKNSWLCVDTKCSQLQQTHPEVLVRGIATRLLHCMKDAAGRSNARGIFDANSAVMMMKTSDFDDIIKSTQKLMMVDLNLLKTQNEKFCFFGNLQNLMTIHLHLHLIKELDTQNQNVAEVNHREKKLFNEMSLVEQITQLKTFSYFVGQIELISLFDLQFIINRHGLQYPLQWEGLLEDTLYDLDALHPWCRYVPEPDPRLMFVTTTCSASSPPFQVLDPELVQSQLEASMQQFLVDTITVDKKRNTVTIPEMLSWYKNDFSTDQDQESGVKYEGIMHLIASHVTGAVQEDLQELLRLDIENKKKNELPFQVGINLHKTEFFIPLDFSMLTENSQKTKTHRRITSLPKNLSISGSSDLSKSTSSSTKTLSESYQLTPATLDYIKTESPLVATLVSLICSDELDDIEEHFDEDYFKQSDGMRSRTASEMSLVDIRSYRYQKLTEDYPVLKRHLLNFVIPVAGGEDPSILKGRDPLLKLISSSFSQKVKACMLNLHDNWQFQMVVTSILNELLQDRKWSEIISVLDNLPITVFRNTQEFTSLHDFTQCSLILKWLTLKPEAEGQVTKEVADSVSRWLHQIICPRMQTRFLLSVHSKLPIDHNIELFQMCENKDLSDALQSAVVKKLTELHMFYRITECAKNLQFKLSMKTAEFTNKLEKEQYHASLNKFTDWRNVLKSDVISPEEVLVVLMKAGDFDTAKAWCHHAHLSHNTYLDVVEHHLVALLGRKPPDMFKAFQILEESKKMSEEESLILCQKLLKTLANQRDVLFIVSFMLSQFDHLLAEDTKDELRMLSMGAKVLLCLPDNIRGDYSHLVTTPVLLIEQLLMNMKVDLAGKAYEIISCDQIRLQNQALRISLDQYDNLVSCYATKALEFYTAQVIQSEKARSPSQMSSASVDREEAVVNTPVKKFQDTVRGRKSVDFSGGVRISSSAPSGGSSPNRTAPLPVKPVSKFVMPAEPPPREMWTPDHSTDTCMLCKVERFSMFNRRHHCRRCGRLVCASCSTKTTVIHGAQARTCDDCFAQTYEQRRPSHRPDTGILPMKDDGKHGSSVTSRNARAALYTGDLETFILHHTQPLWKLKVNDKENNETVREDFFYEQAPSTSLCLSILELHSNMMTSGRLVLRLCDDLSKHLKPIAPGLPNPEVDYSLVISMMKTLLFHAKMKYIKCGETQSMAQCELYQSRIDLLALLVADNYQDLPSLQELTKSDVVMRLRDKLIEDERLALAVEVSTKCGLDAAGVWAAWGMIYLQSGDFTKAREKFSRCLKPPSDRDQIQQSSKLLRYIVDCLDSMSSCNELQCLMAIPSSTKNFLSSPTATNLEESSMESAHFQECLYYLRTYGTFYSIVEFNRRHGYWMKAVQFILDHKCSSEVFVEALLAPALDTGRIGELIDQLVMIDPSLEKWNTYLTASCRYLVKHKLYHVLYDFQVFMKDFIRAAMTCVTYFYLSGAQSYLDLSGRINYLYQAHQHMQAYLDPSQWGDVKCPHAEPQDSEKNYSKTAVDNVRLVQSTEEVTKHMRTMGLQIEVTKYLQECLTNTETDATSVAVVYVGQTKSAQLPSMFSNAKGRVDLINMILLSGDDVRRAYDIAKRIMKECKLGAPKILTHAAREMAKLGRFDHMRVLHECITNDSPNDEDALDELIGACILIISDNPNEAKETDNLIKMLRKDSNKINAYILCGKLRSAYLMAVKSEREEDVQRIAGAAQRMGQTAVKNICNKWLQQRHQ